MHEGIALLFTDNPKTKSAIVKIEFIRIERNLWFNSPKNIAGFMKT
jgi:hypothetical protein